MTWRNESQDVGQQDEEKRNRKSQEDKRTLINIAPSSVLGKVSFHESPKKAHTRLFQSCKPKSSFTDFLVSYQ